MFSIIQAAGWPIWPLLFASVVAVALIIERATALRRNKIVPAGLLQSAIADFRQSGVSDAEAGYMPEQVIERWCNLVAAELLMPLAMNVTPCPARSEPSITRT